MGELERRARTQSAGSHLLETTGEVGIEQNAPLSHSELTKMVNLLTKHSKMERASWD